MKTTLHRILAAGLLLLPGAALHAQNSMVPSAMNYQGFLTDNDGNPVAASVPENRNLEFRIYGHPTANEPLLWGEAQTVTVYKGNFSVILGNGSAISGVPNSGADSLAGIFANATTTELFFGIKPQGGAEFSPRQKLLASAYALRARVAEQVNTTTGTSNFHWVNAANLTVDGHSKITSTNVLEFGVGQTKDAGAGTIGYNNGTAGLNIVGGGETAAARRLNIWADAGTHFNGPLHFGNREGQHINLWGDSYALGINEFTLYMRSAGNFRWYQGGTHTSNATADANGTTLAVLNGTGFTLSTGKFTGDGSGLTNISPSALPNNYNYLGINGGNSLELGRNVSGKANFNGHLYYSIENGVHRTNIVGGGTAANFSDRRIRLHAQGGGVEVLGTIHMGAEKIDKGSSHSVWVGAHADGVSIGNQGNGAYIRSNKNISFFRGGVHSNTELDPGQGGTLMANLTDNGFDFGSSNRPWVGGHGGTYAMGVQDWTTYFRTADRGINFPEDGGFAWYRGGSHHNSKRNAGGGYALAQLDRNGFAVAGQTLWLNSGQYSHLGQGHIWSITVGNNFDIQANGTSRAWLVGLSGAWNLSSDRRLKEDIAPLRSGLETVLKLKPSTYRFKEDKDRRPQLGFIAQDLQEVLPEVVSSRDDGMLGVEYTSIIPVAVSAIQEQQRQIEEVRGENARLSRRLASQEKELETAKAERDALAVQIGKLRAAAGKQEARLAAIEAFLDSAAPAALPAKTAAKTTAGIR